MFPRSPQQWAQVSIMPLYIKLDILPEFFKAFWVCQMPLDWKKHKQVVEATVELVEFWLAQIYYVQPSLQVTPFGHLLDGTEPSDSSI